MHMPSTYAHYRLGNDVKASLTGKIKQLVEDNYESFALGLHGPDLLFYYRPLTNNRTNAIGYAIHERFASLFFEMAGKVYSERGKRAADEAYLLGFLCHFALDSEGHPVVNAEMKAKNLSHTEIESAFDRYLLLKDGKQPLGTDLTAHIHANENTADIAAAYFGVDRGKAKKALKSIKFYNGLLNSASKIKRAFVTAALKISGMWNIMHGMMMPTEIEEKWKDGIAGLENAYAAAVQKAVRLIENYDGYLAGECALSAELERDFE